MQWPREPENSPALLPLRSRPPLNLKTKRKGLGPMEMFEFPLLYLCNKARGGCFKEADLNRMEYTHTNAAYTARVCMYYVNVKIDIFYKYTRSTSRISTSGKFDPGGILYIIPRPLPPPIISKSKPYGSQYPVSGLPFVLYEKRAALYKKLLLPCSGLMRAKFNVTS